MGFVKAVGKEVTLDGKPFLLRGFGLGGWLLPEGYMWKFTTKCDRPRRMEALVDDLCGSEYGAAFWESYYDTYITEADMVFIAGEGFNSVRLPLNARHMDEADMWRHVDDCIHWCKKHGLYVILDMHGAPGGQTGQNIDDSEHDQPELFQKREHQEALIRLWQRIAARYKDEEVIAGYDLLNEPLPEFFGQYNSQVLPLYRELAGAIREIDKNHMLILEGVHWATDFSIFDPLKEQPFDHNCMLQFHRYWSNPDQDGIEAFLGYREGLSLPLFMGEGGENNLDWYLAAFALYERLNISWSFWTYKKMDCENSPVTFPMPANWPRLLRYLDGGEKPGREEAQGIFDGFLASVKNASHNQAVLRALKREAPLTIPAEHFDRGHSPLSRIPGAAYRLSEPLSILFHSGKVGPPHYQRMGGEPQPQEERLYVLLRKGENVEYRYHSAGAHGAALWVKGQGELLVEAGKEARQIAVLAADWEAVEISCGGGEEKAPRLLKISCLEGQVCLDQIEVK